MADQAEDCERNFQSFLPAIYEWHLLHSVPMMNGAEVGQRLCNIDLQAMAHSMVTLLVICF
jgi:hypothetical protein